MLAKRRRRAEAGSRCDLLDREIRRLEQAAGAWELPPSVLEGVVHSWARRGFKREFGELWRTEARRCPHGRARYLLRYAGFGLGLRLAPFAE